jgi:lysophospholipase L1-like esterase
VIYHTIGVNGATFRNYNSTALFFDELKELKPDLVIVSLGTNESVSDIDEGTFTLQLDLFIQHLQTTAPGSAFMLTTPADNFVKRATVKMTGKKKKRKVKRITYVNNAKAETIRNAEIAYCGEHHIAYWDLYTVMGGEHSMNEWVRLGIAAKDHIHFSKKGYEIQAGLLFDALLHSYQSKSK